MQKILICLVRRLFVDNAEIFEIGTLIVTHYCDKVIPQGHTIFTLVTHTCTKITIPTF